MSPVARILKPRPQPSLMPTDGFALSRAPLAPPYAVVLISCSGLLAFIFLLLTCLCCKRGDVRFKVRCPRTNLGERPQAAKRLEVPEHSQDLRLWDPHTSGNGAGI